MFDCGELSECSRYLIYNLLKLDVFIFFSDVLFYEYVIVIFFFFNLWRSFVLSQLEKRDHTSLQVSRLAAETKTRK